MSFQTQTCTQCWWSYEYYQSRNIVPDCPHCGALGGFAQPLTSAEYYRAMGVETVKPSTNLKGATPC